VPPLLLQPLVENALRHGVSDRTGRGTVQVSVRREADTVRIDVVGDGPGYHEPRSATSPGVGLRNTRARLEGLYPDHHRLEISTVGGQGTRVRLVLPYQMLESTA
jgi:two-component system LytT family sensor kinase